jgi:hypothetical protein
LVLLKCTTLRSELWCHCLCSCFFETSAIVLHLCYFIRVECKELQRKCVLPLSQIKGRCRSCHQDQCSSMKILTPLHGNLAGDGDMLQNEVREQCSGWEILFYSILHTVEAISARFFCFCFCILIHL